MAFMDVIAGTKTQKFFLLQIPVREILYVFQTGRRLGECCLTDELSKMIALSCIPFRIYQKSQAILKGHIPVLRILQLVLERICHDAQPHFTQLGNCRCRQHDLSLLP